MRMTPQLVAELGGSLALQIIRSEAQAWRAKLPLSLRSNGMRTTPQLVAELGGR